MKDAQCGTWTDAYADNWISIFFRKETNMYMMEYELYDSGVRGRQKLDLDFFNKVVKHYAMKKAF